MEITLPLTDTYLTEIVAPYTAVAVGMGADFIAGIRRAGKAGVARTSRGYKMTCAKAMKYYLPMVCLTAIDVIASPVLPLPFLTMAMGAFNLICEWKSIMESTRDKAEIARAARTVSLIIENKEDIVAAIAQILKDEKEVRDEK